MSVFSFNFRIDDPGGGADSSDDAQSGSPRNNAWAAFERSSAAIESVQESSGYRDKTSKVFMDCERKILGSVELEVKKLIIPTNTTEELLKDALVAANSQSGLLRVAGYGSGSKANDHALVKVTDQTDVLSGYYEGGFKLWECANDLSQYISERVNLEDFFHAEHGIEKPRILELGCGHGFPAIKAFLKFGASKVVFQDMNHEVLKMCTSVNLLLNINNLKADSGKTENSPRHVRAHESGCFEFWCGDWLSLMKQPEWTESGIIDGAKDGCKKMGGTKNTFDLILSADTIYAVEQIQKLSEFLTWTIQKNKTAVALVAAKRYYFGTGGSVKVFADRVKLVSKGSLDVQVVASYEDKSSNIRDILQIKYVQQK